MGLNSGKREVDKRKQVEEMRSGRMYETQRRFDGADGVARTDTVMLPYDSLQRYRYNRDATKNLEELADNIYENGLLSSLRVTEQKFGGKHYILAGERRWNAIGLLRQKYPDDERFKFVKCELSPAQTEFDMLTETLADNMDRENPTVKEFRDSIERLRHFYDEADANGIIINESRKKFVKRMIGNRGLSDRQLRRYTKVAEDTIDEIQELVDSGKLTLNTAADRIGYMDKDSQRVLAGLAEEGLELTDDNVKKFASSEEISELREQIIEKDNLIKKLREEGSGRKKTSAVDQTLAKELAKKKKLEKQIVNNIGTNYAAINKKLKDIKRKVYEFKPYIGEITLTESEKDYVRDICSTLSSLLNN